MEEQQLSPAQKTIRKIRKKLRQIEHLELLDRELNEEEDLKVSRKLSLREDLKKLLEEHHLDETDVMKQHSILLREEESNVKKCRSIDSSNIKQEVQDELEAQEAFQLIDTSGNDSKHQESLTSLSSTYSSPAGVLQSDKNNVSCVENVSRKTLASVDSLQHHAISQNASDVESKSQTSKKASKGSIAGSSGKKENFLWRECSCDVYTLEGHNDIVLGVDCTNSFVLSASRDTTVRVWRVGNIKEERSLRGHTAAVTVVAFLPESLAVAILAKYEVDCNELPAFQKRVSSERRVLAVSGGLDCMLKVWDIISGECLRSIYTYNGITCLGCGTWGVVTGTEGGKLEIWCLVTSHRLAFINAFQSQTTALDIEGDDIYAGSSDGEFGIWRFDGTCETLQVLYIMEAESSTYVPLKHLASVLAHNEKCLLGDSGPNIKVVDWKKGHVSRLVNHLGDIGMTDSLAVSADGYLLAASYLVDSGCSSINIREAASFKYICSLIDNNEGRYLAMSTSSGVIVTGGHLLKVWVLHDSSASPKKGKKVLSEVILPSILHKMSRAVVDSASEDDTDWASSSDDDDVQQFASVRGDGSLSGEVESSRWWCNVL
ncbi:uncharacterized protein [Cherax quadricarinatus]